MRIERGRNGVIEEVEIDLAALAAQAAAFDDPLRREYEYHRLYQEAVQGYPLAEDPASAELVRDLSHAYGFPVDHVWIPKDPAPYRLAAAVMIRHLDRNHPPHLRLHLLHMLSRREALPDVLPALRRLLEQSRNDATPDDLWALGNAFAAVASRGNLDALLEIAADPRNRGARGPVVQRIARFKSDRVADICRRFIASDLERATIGPWHAITAVRLQKLWDVAHLVEPYLRDEQEGPREAARAYFKALGSHFAAATSGCCDSRRPARSG